MPTPVPDDHPPLLTFLQRHTPKTLRTLGVLRSTFAKSPVLVDNPDQPRAVLTRHGRFHAFYTDDPNRGLDLLQETLDWTQPHAFAGLHSDHLELVERCAPIAWSNPCSQYHLDAQAGDRLVQEHRPDPHIQPLSPEHAALVLTHWPYGNPEDPAEVRVMQDRIQNGISAAWFPTPDSPPVSWAMTHHDTSLGCMHTLQDWRRQGIGLNVAQSLLVRALRANITPHCHVVAQNTDPQSILHALHMERSEGTYSWLTTKPHL